MAAKLQAKIFISGEIHLKTGLHIGGASSSLDIGGLDNGIIKTAKGLPYIPGSTLKGKLRNMLARLSGSNDVKNDNEKIRMLFGSSAEGTEENARLIVRDAYLDETKFNEIFSNVELELGHSEVKWENTIDRKNSTANPRQLERVPAGAIFKFELVLDDYDDKKTSNLEMQLRIAMRLLEGDYIGGSGTRGYGQIKFETLNSQKMTIDENGTVTTANYNFML